ncbi:MAG: metal ABC transporter permease [Alphaproteobacteria bacterium]|nr:metal ABC transporter permease [Alphaproteobacteria bacterium]
MILYEILFSPFIDFTFMRRALVGAMALSLSACPIGVFLMLRRMSLTGDAMAHAILPGAAIGFLVSGLSLLPMTAGGVIAGLCVALLSGTVSRLTIQREDASLAGFYLVSLALGVLLISLKGTNIDLMHILFGTVLALNDNALKMITSISTITILTLAVIWRPLVAECLDPVFLGSISRIGSTVHFLFLTLVVVNLVGGFQALGTLLAVGLMMLPALSARLWCVKLESMCILAVVIGLISSYIGLLVSYHIGVASGPAIILTAGAAYTVALVTAPQGVVRSGFTPKRHRIA